MTRESSPDDLITLTTVPSPFEAHTIVGVLKNAAIEAIPLERVRQDAGLTLRPEGGVPIQVQRRDYERAREVLEANASGAAGIDWDEVNVGARIDELPLRKPGRIPWPARIAGAVVVLMLVAALLGWLVMWLWL